MGTEGENLMNLLQMLKDDHDRLRKLLEDIESFDENAVEKRKKAASELFLELEIHIRLEEEILYPSALEVFDKKGKPLRIAVEEHQRMKTWMKNLKELSPNDEEYKIQFSLFREALKHHLEEEEKELFPQTENLLNKESMSVEPLAEEYSSDSPRISE